MPRPCNRCGQPIGFRKQNGAWRPTNQDGAWHECRKPARVDFEAGRSIIGANYAPVDCACPALPWEFCACFPSDGPANLRNLAEPRLSVLMGEAMEC